MQTRFSQHTRATDDGREAEAILRTCVHCGFCTAACPTYRLLGAELDSPRGRIYLIKSLLEDEPVAADAVRHLDRCLTCRACESACPSGVEYGRLLEIGRRQASARARRPLRERLLRRALTLVLPYRRRTALLLALARGVRPLLPASLREQVPPRWSAPRWPEPRHRRTVVALEGCVQPLLAPGIDAAAATLLDRVGVSLVRVRGTGCCGALPHHLGFEHEARVLARANVDALEPALAGGAEAVLVNASGCGAMMRDYGHLLRGDADYAARAAGLARRVRDPVEMFTPGDLTRAGADGRARTIALHAPCSLQHALHLGARTESLLRQIGYQLVSVPDATLCCGSAGSYSLLQPDIARQLRTRKISSLQENRPSVIVTANIGCQSFLAAAAPVPVRHWLEQVLADADGPA